MTPSSLSVNALFAGLERSQLGAALLELDGRFLRVNPALCQISGFAAERLLASGWDLLQPAAEQAGCHTLLQGFCDGSTQHHHIELRLQHQDGRRLWVSLNLLLLQHEDGQRGPLLALFEDVTHRKHSEAGMLSLMNSYTHLFHHTPDSVLLFDDSGRVVSFNQKALERYGYTADEMVQLHMTDLTVSETPEQIRERRQRMNETGQDSFFSRHRTKYGTLIDLHVSAQVIALPDGNRLCQALLHDITEQTQREDSLLEAQERLQLALESAEEGMWEWDIAHDTLVVSAQWARMLGLQPSDIRTLADWRRLCHPHDLEEAERRLQAHCSGALPVYEFEHRLRHARGDWIWVFGKAKVVRRDDAGQPLRVVGTNIDITARKLAQQTLHEEIVKNQILFRTSMDGLHILDSKGNLLQASDSFYRMLGYTEQEMRGMNVLDWDVEMPADTDFEAIVGRLPAGGQTLHTRQRRKDGSVISVEINAIAVTVYGVRYLYASMRDVTERLRTEQLLREREATLRAILDNMPHMAWLKDLQGRYLAVNEKLSRTAGFSSPAQMEGKTDREVWPQPLADKYRADDIEVAESRRQKFMEEHGLDQGRQYWSETFKTPIIDSSGNVLGTTGYALDITERKQAEESMRLSAAIYQHSTEAILVTDEDNHIIDVNPAFTEITGYTLDEVRLRDPRFLQSGRHDHAFYQEMWRQIVEQGHWQGEIWDRRKNGEVYPKWVTISVIRHPDGRIHRHIAQFSDITEKKRKEEQIWRQANFDMLTELPNRRLFRDRLEQEMRKSKRTGKPLALMFIDLDRFKEVNDTLGHDVGDLLLVEAAGRICACVRESDTVARLGGDEFTVILPEFGTPQNIERVAQHIIENLTAPFTLQGEACYISASIGITLYPNDAQSQDELMKHADQAMYAAKEEGRNRFRYYTAAMQQRVDERTALTNELRLALERGQLEVHYQPIVDLADGSVHKAEALLRWRHPQRGMVSPVQFIPLAEESGLILPIGDWVFHQAIACASRARYEHGIPLQISVNKSPVQFTGGNDARTWLESMSVRGLPHDMIAVEITEGLMLKDSPEIRRQFELLERHGIQLSLDDFGTGYSSLSYLQKFKVHYLKIDRSFISHLTPDANDLALVEAIIVMAHKLGIRTIAEGVETEVQRDMLRQIGCDYAQGYWYARPLPEDTFIEYLTSRDRALA